MAAVATVRVDDDLATGEAAVAHRPADDEAAGRVDVVACLRVEVLRRQRLLDDLVGDRFRERLVGDVGRVLRRDDDGIDADRPAVAILDRHLRLGIRTEKRHAARLADLRQTLDQAMRHRDRERHELVGLVAGVAEHQALVARALLLVQALACGDALGDVRRLPVDRDQHHVGRGVADLAHCAPGDVGVRHVHSRRDLARDDDHAGLDERLAGNATVRILGDERVEDGVRDLVAHLVGMTFGHGLGGEQEIFERHAIPPRRDVSPTLYRQPL